MNSIELNLSDMNWCKATIEQQAERIKELEERYNVLHMTYAETYNLLGATQKELTALRQRIADAPVVAWLCEWDNWHQYHDDSDPLPKDNEWDDKPNKITPLISKEDLL